MAKPKQDKKLPTPPQSQEWARPPFPTVGDKDPSIIFLAVGRALTSWERLEGTLGNIFIETIGLNYFSALAALRAYGSVMSFSGRFDMLTAATDAVLFQRKDEVGETFFGCDPELQKLKEATKILDRSRGFSARRNEIAHGVVEKHPNNLRSLVAMVSEDHGWVLVPSEFSTAKRQLEQGTVLTGPKQSPAYYYTGEQISAFQAKFDQLTVDAREYLKLFRQVIRARQG